MHGADKPATFAKSTNSEYRGRAGAETMTISKMTNVSPARPVVTKVSKLGDTVNMRYVQVQVGRGLHCTRDAQ